ncbi:MAG: glycosyltransferase family 2 protein [Bacteroidales bacterium]|nr:glycosyltransferase family 2 protein [Bacteroidales bacterium]MCC8152759.1 glycosyltransferase family 2 protein [Tannerellaceae bacterium]
MLTNRYTEPGNLIFSLLIPVYNVEKYLPSCLDSILQQPGNDYEVVLLDDASTDNSRLICEEYKNKFPEKIRVASHEENRGQLLTRKDLFQLARGEWILCIDSDDWLSENALTVIRHAILTEETDLIVYNVICKYMDGTEKIFSPDLNADIVYCNDNKMELYNQFLCTYYLNSMCNKAIHHKLIDLNEKHEEVTEISIGEDRFQSFPIIDRAKKVLYLNQNLYYYRKNIDGISSKSFPNMYEMRKILWEREDIYIEKWEITSDIREKRYIQRINEVVQMMQGKKETGEFAEFSKEIIADRILEKLLETVDVAKLCRRYLLVCELVTHRQIFLADKVVSMELWMRNLKRKHGEMKKSRHETGG